MNEMDWRDVPQFKSISFAGHAASNGVLWIVTVKGELFRQANLAQVSKVQLPSEVDKPDLISFVDSQRGWLLNTGGVVWRTIDGGQSWESLSTSKIGGERFYIPRQLVFVNESKGWLINNFTIWRTDDAGVSWKHLISSKDMASEGIWKPLRGSFINALKGWVAATDGILTTKDGGETWQRRVVEAKTGFADVQFIDERTGWIVGGPSGIYRSDDGGVTWQHQFSGKSEGVRINSVYFPTLMTGWAVGLRTNGEQRNLNRGVVLHTTDGGRTWHNINVGENDLFFDRVYFVDEQHGWLFARDNVYLTENGGETWRLVFELPPIKNKSK